MPVSPIGFMLKPDGFFDRNPALDVPPAPPKNGCCRPATATAVPTTTST